MGDRQSCQPHVEAEMKVVLLAGGLGTRLSEETDLRPKPMVEIGGRPILWHIMKLYGSYGFTDFVVCLGYKGHVIKEYFANYFMHQADVTFDLASNQMQVHTNAAEPWKVTLIETGAATMTGGRVKRAAPYLAGERFMLTYGDGLADVDLAALLAHHERAGALATITAVQPPGRFGALDLAEGQERVDAFLEKPAGDGAWINGGFFVCEPEVLERIAGDETSFEQEPLQGLAAGGELTAYRHTGFWQPMDTLREKHLLESLWQSGSAPWKRWP